MIIFKTVKWKNLLSSGNNFTELKLDEHATTLILGENGSGKSTLLDAMCFGLYGRGFRNLKKELLVNSVNQSGLLVEINFSIGKREYKVIRGVKPNKFEIYVDNVFVNQDATVRDYQEHLEKNSKVENKTKDHGNKEIISEDKCKDIAQTESQTDPNNIEIEQV